ncbi:phosphonate C-P lyase system protein PhnG [Sporolactobacillus shoreicorticis]|uniref:Phosphonate C-P lyase system protein PhnG n=1 Tax=Sporolactobacillus shoreicorticis TaxID=1923877 RepID=A0ABW5S0T5_9BACL|nr:phosphonate C-P lyase system protein PhnG [Sporolactobacillus shoreicorticis]MCO7125265.1 phosphonate C-P lyase system protein PhnG [Sporolactobacillus shoreicorticis]
MVIMTKQHLSRIMSACSLPLLEEIAHKIEQEQRLQVEREPQTSLIMTKAKDSVSSQPFYLGEVLVTECTVSLNGQLGVGIVIGKKPVRAYCMAVIDAAHNAGLPVLDHWNAQFHEEEKRIQEKYALEDARNAQSQVHFNTMEEYNDKR